MGLSRLELAVHGSLRSPFIRDCSPFRLAFCQFARVCPVLKPFFLFLQSHEPSYTSWGGPFSRIYLPSFSLLPLVEVGLFAVRSFLNGLTRHQVWRGG